jgi:metallothiol transferase
MEVRGFSHVTIRVRDLGTSLRFYVDLLGMRLRHRGNRDVYLEWGKAWICLLERPELEAAEKRSFGVDHVAFYMEEMDFHQAVNRLREHGVRIVRGPVVRGGGWTVNFLDPDGTELELHTGTLEKRLEQWP